jgi:MinD-like ATPase involved in chromosome partitioning or flagellar assembly
MAAQGLRVGVIDTDLPSPGIHVLFGVQEDQMGYTLNDYLWGKCDIRQAARDVSPNLGVPVHGQLFLVPSSVQASEIARVVREGYDVNLLNDGFNSLIEDLQLDVLIIDTHPGMNEETLLSIAISDVLLIILRPDQQDFQGTSVTVEVARRLDVPRLLLMINKLPAVYDRATVKQRVEELYEAEVATVIPHSDELMALASAGIFTLRYPDHAVTQSYQQLTAKLLQ